ncbi:MAG: type VI secretion system tube protein Hcp [Planctomycetaceae bacterium]|jgi:type VI secretion system secreted protein Hcp|nr:type VI secretion system tube protein Hcp [Planctomycetaceae bacterium]
MQSMFLKIDGISGECTLEKYKNQIEIYSFSLGFSQPTSALRSSEGGGTVARPHCSDISFSKRYDISSPSICQVLWAGKTIKEVVLTLCRSDDKSSMIEYMKITMSNVVISNYNISGGGDLPGETFSMNYSKIAFDYKQQKEEGGSNGTAASSYDLSSGKLT